MQPESALMAYAENDDLTLFFQTSDQSRKFQNLAVNPKVSFVVGFSYITIQYEGRAEIIEIENDKNKIIQLFKDKNSPTTPKYFEKTETKIFKVTPSWIGYSNYTKDPPLVFEIDLTTH